MRFNVLKDFSPIRTLPLLSSSKITENSINVIQSCMGIEMFTL